MVGSKFMALLRFYSSLADQTSSSPSSDYKATIRKTASGNWCKNLNAIQRLDQKLWPFWPVTQGWPTRHPRHLVGNPKQPKGNRLLETSVDILARSNGHTKSYGPFTRFSSLADWTSSSQSSDSSTTPVKTASTNSSNNLSAIKRSDQNLWLFWDATQVEPTRPPIHRVAIPKQP